HIISDSFFSNTLSNVCKTLSNNPKDSIQGRYIKNKKTLLLFTIILCSFNFSLNAQCDANSDFVQFSTTNWYDIDVPNDNRPDNAGQTFIATCSGPIRGVTLGTDNVSGGNIGGASMTAQLWRNPFSNGRVLMTSQTQDLPFSPAEGSNVDHYFPFTSLPQLVSGTEYAVVFVLNDTQYTVGVRVDVNNVYTSGNFIRDWSTTGTGSWDLRTRVHYEDNVAPEANCKDITRALGANNTLNLNAGAINNNSTDADSGLATFSLSKSNFDCNDVGYNSVRLIVTDQNGNSSSCESVVIITDGNDPVLTCPGDMTVTADAETGTAIVNYADVTYDDCTFEWVDGFDFIGTHDGRSYFVSHNPLVPSEAFANAELQGGHIATVIDAEHNEWLRAAVDNQGLTNENILIGYNDIVEEDTFVWHNPNGGSTYENWATIEPNNAGGNEDYTIMNGGGRWNDVNNNTARIYILEKSEANIRQSSGLVSGSEFPIGTTINYFSATDAFGNTGNCFFIVEVLPPPTETTVVLDNGKLIITDIESDSNDQITFSSDGTTLTISDLITPSVTGGPTLFDPTTVTVPLASITNGIEFSSANGSNNGFNIITFANDLTLTGVNNGITLTGLKNYEQTGSINIEGDLTINGIGFDLTLGEITANNFTIDGVDRILDQELALTISGVTQLQAGDGVNIENGQGRHTFGGEVILTSNELIFSAGADTTFGEINATDAGIGIAHTFTAAPGNITFNGDVTVLGGNGSTLFVCSFNNISQTGGSIDVPFLVFRGNGNTTVTIDNNNNIEALGTSNPFDPNAVDLASLSFTNTSNMFLEDIDVVEFNLTAPQFDFEPDFTNITKRGSGVSNFNADIDMNNGTGTAIINHNAGTINFNGDTNDFLSQMTYTGQPGTITNIISSTTTFPVTGPNRGFTFGTLNANGIIDTNNIDIYVTESANFSGDTTLLAGSSYLQGPLTTISDSAIISPGGGTTGLEYTFDDLTMNTGATFAPLIEGTGASEFDKLAVAPFGTVTLDDANLSPNGGYVIGPDDELIIINNYSNNPVVGIFNGLPEGSEVVFGDFEGIISYTGGDGNDVVLRSDNVAPNAVCQDIILEIGFGEITVTGDQLDSGATDNVGITEILIDGQASLDFTIDDLGDHEVTVTFVDANGNTSECMATITLVSNVDYDVLISEYQPVEGDGTSDQQIEIIGKAGESFAGTFVVIEGDVNTGEEGLVVAAYELSGVFDPNNLLVTTISNIPDPTHTVVLTSSFSGTVGTTNIDNGDGTVDVSVFGLILDAIGITNGAVCCPIDVIYGEEFGGTDLPYIGGQASAIFRDASVGDFYQISLSTGDLYDNTATIVDASSFNTTPTLAGTFGSINPIRLSVDCDNHTTW
ncbi:lectin-like protein, partial [Dokdonia sp.]|uniref:lectin-like protein n=1 Tax=Dokdonia sp. TaxID=2024995 RepID=UPI0032673976